MKLTNSLFPHCDAEKVLSEPWLQWGEITHTNAGFHSGGETSLNYK